jgi:hypothetical protein
MRILFLLLAVSVAQAQVNFCKEIVATPKVDGDFEMHQNGFVTTRDYAGNFNIYNDEGKIITKAKNFKIYKNGLVVTRDTPGYSDVYNSKGKKITSEKEVDIHQEGLILTRSITNIFTIYNIEGEVVASGRTAAQKLRNTKKESVAKPCNEEEDLPAHWRHRIR